MKIFSRSVAATVFMTLLMLFPAGPARGETSPAGMSFTYGGDAPWALQSAISHDGIDSHQSGGISHSQSSWMETTVTGPGAIRFWWKVSSEGCCDPLNFSIDGNYQAGIRGQVDWQPKGFYIPAGTHTLRWTYSTDGSVLSGSNAGWVDQITFQEGSNIDVTPPTTTATPAGNTYATPQTVTLSANESATIYYTTNGTDPTTSSPQYSTPITISTTTYLSVFAVDSWGNYESPHSMEYRFDTTPPTTSAYPSAGTYVGQRSVILNCYDTGSYCNGIYYCLGTGCTPSTLYTSAITVSSSTDLRFYSTDYTGNSEAVKTVQYVITADTTPPTTTAGYRAGTYRPFYQYLSCSDGSGSGCAATFYCLGAGCTPDQPFSSSIYISSSTDFRFFSRDNSGNDEAVQTATYVIDTTPPVTTESPGAGIYQSAQTVTLTCRDGGSGCSGTYYCLGKDCYPNSTYTAPIAISGSTYLRFRSVDAVQNYESARTVRYTILTAPPVTINVPADRSTIQAAIDAATDGDTVLVAPGTYTENLNLKGKAVTIISSGGPGTTILDGNRTGPVVMVNSGEGRSTVLDGFTIRNGNASAGYGGGINIYNTSPTIRNNRVTGNSASWGGGIYAGFGSPLILNNIITSNNGSEGGGVCLGGEGSAEVRGNTITHNTGANGGGISLWAAGTPIISDNTIMDNVAGGQGGGMSMVNRCDALVLQNVIARNTASRGGGIYWSTPSGSQGSYLANNTIATNSATQGSGVLADGYDANTILINNIIVGNPGSPAVFCGYVNDKNPPQFRNNVVYTSGGAAFDGGCGDQNGINGNVTADPRLSSTALGYYGLLPGSPAIDAGDNLAQHVSSADFGGAARLVDGTAQGGARIDAGAYEYVPDLPRAVLAGAPTGVTTATSATITVVGDGIVSYRYSVDGGPFGASDISISNPIVLNDLQGGSHSLAVIGTADSRRQDTASATVAEWTIDDAPPVTTATPDGGTYGAAQEVTLTCNDGTGGGCAATYYCLGTGCTPTTPCTGPIAIGSETDLRFSSMDLFGHNEEIKTVTFRFVGSISGRVTDSATGNGLGFMYVEACSGSSASTSCRNTFTDGNGNYTFNWLPAGTYKVYVTGNYYLPQWFRNGTDYGGGDAVTVTPLGATTGIDLAMVKGGTISGRITDSVTGAGIPYAGIAVYPATTDTWFLANTYSDYDGYYTLGGLRTGHYKVVFGADGYIQRWYDNSPDRAHATAVAVTAATATSNINGALGKAGMITGKVTNAATGAAIPSAFISVYDTNNNQIGYAYTDGAGSFAVTGLASGSYKVKFYADTYLEQWYDGTSGQGSAITVQVTAPQTTAGINAALSTGGTISGTVTDSTTGAGIQGVSAIVYDAVSSQGSFLGYAYTDSSGAYTIAGLPSGTYKIRFSADRYPVRWYGGATEATATVVTVTAPGTTTGINVAMTRGGSISGTVTDSSTGTRLSNIYVTVYDATTPYLSMVSYGVTDASGAYTVTGLPSGTYKVRFYGSGYLSWWYGGSSTSTGSGVTVSAPASIAGINMTMTKGGSISGILTDSITGTGAPNVQVLAYDSATSETMSYGLTDASGAYTVTGLPSGTYKVRFSGSGYLQEWYGGASESRAAVVTVVAPTETTGVNAVLHSGGSITGRVTDRTGNAALPSIDVIAYGRDTGEWAGSATTDEDGTYTVSGLPTGEYRLFFSSGNGYLGEWYDRKGEQGCADTVSVTAPAATAEVNMSLLRGGSISGRVTDAVTGAGVAGISIQLQRVSQGNVLLGYVASGLVTNGSGEYSVQGLESGEYRVSFYGNGYVRQWYGEEAHSSPTAVTVTAPAATTGINGALVKGGAISGRVSDSMTGEGIDGIWVYVFDSLTGSWITGAGTDATGAYTIDDLPSGSYKIQFLGESAAYVSTWFDGKQNSNEGVEVSVTSPAVTTGIDVVLSKLANGGGSISGTITDRLTGLPIRYIYVQAVDTVTGRVTSAYTDQEGTYTLKPLTAGAYKVQSTYGHYVTQWFPNAATPDSATEVTVTAHEATPGIHMALTKGGSISGRVIVSTCPSPGQFRITAFNATTGNPTGAAWVSPQYSNTFTIDGLPSGSYKLNVDTQGTAFVSQWYSNKRNSADADPVEVTAPDSTEGIEIHLIAGAAITGKITDSSGSPVPFVTVVAADAVTGTTVATTFSNQAGTYAIRGLPSGSYTIFFAGNGSLHGQWYKTQPDLREPSVITVSAPTPVEGVDAVLRPFATWGDVNGDGRVGIVDALLALRISVGLVSPTSDQIVRGDVAPLVNGEPSADGIVDLSDAVVILRHAIGLMD